MSAFKRVFVIVMDSVGVGHDPDAHLYGDTNPNTLKNIDRVVGGLQLPTLQKLGLGLLDDYLKVKPVTHPLGYVTRVFEASLGKDTMTGHWEMMGLHITKPFKTFTDTGFPPELIRELEQRTGRKVIGNVSASGTTIIEELGEQHMTSGDLIVYTSADSVLQIAAHEDIIPIEEQYRICEIARDITMRDEWKLGRIIARPFIGTNRSNFKRTPRRHDYALSPFQPTYLDVLKSAKVPTIAIGKIIDIFNGAGISEYQKTVSNEDGMDKTIALAKTDFSGFVFVNLVEFDSEYGHRRDPVGYGRALEAFDKRLQEFIEVMNDDDIVLVTADHGNDPTHAGTDHTRETVPLLIYSPRFKNGGTLLAPLNTYGSIGKLAADNFKVSATNLLGESVLAVLR